MVPVGEMQCVRAGGYRAHSKAPVGRLGLRHYAVSSLMGVTGSEFTIAGGTGFTRRSQEKKRVTGGVSREPAH